MADDIRSNLGDPDNFAGLPWPASPVSASGQDPDEARLLMGGVQAPETQQQAAERLMQQYGRSSGASPSATIKPQTSVVASPAPAAPTAAAGPVGVAAAPSVTGNEAAPADWTSDNAQRGTGMQLEAGRRLMETGAAMQPDASIPKLQQQVAADEAAAPHAQDYKPGFGTRVLRGLKGAALGAAEGGIFGAAAGALDPALVRGGTGYSAPTDAYDIALDANKRQTASDQQALQDKLANFKAAQDLLTGQTAAYSDAAKAAEGAATGATNEANANTKAAEVPIDREKADAEMQKALNLSKDGKLQTTQAEIDQRTRFADQMRMPPGPKRTRYILTGQMQAAPTRAASEEENNLNRLVEAFRHGHNGQGPTTVADWQGLIQAARGGEPRANTQADTNLRTAASIAQRQVAALTRQLNDPHAVMRSPADTQQLKSDLDAAQKNLASLQGLLTSPATQETSPAAPASAPANAAHAPANAMPAPGQRQGQPPAMKAGANGRVRMKLPNGKTASFAPDKAMEAWHLGADPVNE